jgi:hypothetical protein
MVKMTGEQVYDLIQLGLYPEVTFTQDCVMESLTYPIFKGMKATLLNGIAGDYRYLGLFDLSPYALHNQEIERMRRTQEVEDKHQQPPYPLELKEDTRLCYFNRGEIKFSLDTDEEFFTTFYAKKTELFTMQYLDSCIKHLNF